MGKQLKAVSLQKLPAGMHCDGEGLYLCVQESGSRSWILRTTVKGKRTEIGLGGLSTASLAQAREQAAEWRARARRGEDIRNSRKADKRIIPTFEEIAITVHSQLSETFASEMHAYNWLRSLETYVLPIFGKKTVDGIDSADVLRAIGPIWTTKAATARSTLRRIKAVLDYSIVKGYRTVDVNGLKVTMPNPCDSIRAALPKQNGVEKHHEALPYADAAGFIEKLRTSKAALAVRLSFEFLILTCARTNEVLGATWEEIDMEERVWVVPADRMKMDREHRVPLSPRAIEILMLARQFNDGQVIFPGRYPGHPLSNMSLLMALRRMGYATLTAHGFRSSFKTWCHEQTKTDHLIVEASMAHSIKGIERHYLRSTFFDQRRKLMDAWSRFATGSPMAKVVSMRPTP